MADYFVEVDRMNPAGLLAWYGRSASFRFGSAPAVHGRAALQAALAGFYATIRSMSHRGTGVWVDVGAGSGVWEAEVTFVTNDGRSILLPAVSVLRLQDGLVHDFRFVMDAAPLSGPTP